MGTLRNPETQRIKNYGVELGLKEIQLTKRPEDERLADEDDSA